MKMYHYLLPLFLTSIFIISSCKHEPEEINHNQTVLDQATVVKVEDIVSSMQDNGISAIGIIMSETETRPSFKTGGVIDKTLVKEGDMVQSGQLLATLHLDEIQAQVVQAQEGLQKAERDMKRVKNLYQDSVATLEQYQNVTTAYEVAKRSLDIAKFNQSYSQIKSSISGKVIKQLMKSGEITGPGNPVYVIMGIGKQDWRIHVGLVDEDWAKIEKGDKAIIYLDAYPGKKYSGTVKDKSSLTNALSGTFDVEISFDEASLSLAAGMTSQVTLFPKVKSSYPSIPIEALVRTNGKEGEVFVVDQGVARKKHIRIANMLGDKVTVSSGLEGVAQVVTTGAMYLEDGEKVKY